MASLETLAEAASGQVIAAADDAALQGVYDTIAARLTNQYQLTFEAQGRGQPAEIAVRVRQGDVTGTIDRVIELPAASSDPGAANAPTQVQRPENDWALPVGLGAIAVGLLIGGLIVFAPGRNRRKRERRAPVVQGGWHMGQIKELAQRASSLAERSLEDRGRRRALSDALEHAGLAIRPGEFIVLGITSAFVALAIGFLLGGPIMGLVFGGLVGLAFRFSVTVLAERRRGRFASQLGDTLQLLSGSLRAGYGMLQALDAVAREAESPTADEFGRVVIETRLGRNPSESLHALAKRMGNEDFEWVVQAIDIHREVGGDLTEVLDTVAATIRAARPAPPAGQGALGRGPTVGRHSLRPAVGDVRRDQVHQPRLHGRDDWVHDGSGHAGLRRLAPTHGRLVAAQDREAGVLGVRDADPSRLGCRRRLDPAAGVVDRRARAQARPKKVNTKLDAEAAFTDLRELVLQRSAKERVVRPGVAALAQRARRFTPAGMVKKLEHRIHLAGAEAEWPIERLLALKMILGGAGALLGLVRLLTAPSFGSLLLAAVTTAVGYFAPDVLMAQKASKRQDLLKRELADTLDQITISVEAGLGFEPAMARAARSRKGPLASELSRTLQDVQLGVPRSTALKHLVDRTDVSDLRSFVHTVTQAEKYGVPIARILRVQSGELREKRRQAAEERAMKLPVKIVMPLILFILPALFIVLMGPAAIRISQTGFGG